MVGTSLDTAPLTQRVLSNPAELAEKLSKNVTEKLAGSLRSGRAVGINEMAALAHDAIYRQALEEGLSPAAGEQLAALAKNQVTSFSDIREKRSGPGAAGKQSGPAEPGVSGEKDPSERGAAEKTGAQKFAGRRGLPDLDQGFTAKDLIKLSELLREELGIALGGQQNLEKSQMAGARRAPEQHAQQASAFDQPHAGSWLDRFPPAANSRYGLGARRGPLDA